MVKINCKLGSSVCGCFGRSEDNRQRSTDSWAWC